MRHGDRRAHRLAFALTLACAASAVAADIGAGATHRLAADATCGKLLAPAEGAYFGAFPDFNTPEAASEDDVTAAKVNAFQRLAGRRIALAYFSQYWFKGLTFPRAEVLTLWRNGQIPYIAWLPSSGLFYGPGTLQENPELVFSLQNILDGQFDEPLQRWADAARDTNIPILVEFGTEVNDPWGPWNGLWNGAGETFGYGDPSYPDGAERFRDTYRYLVSLFRRRGATNVTWFFHADTFRQSEWWNELKWYFPGDDYVDWLGFSNYGSLTPTGPIVGFIDKLDYSGVYTDLTRLSTRPAAIVEMGVVDDDAGRKPGWIRDALEALRSGRYPLIRGFTWWHMRVGDSDTRIDSSPESLEAFRAGVADPFFGAQPSFSGRCAPDRPRNVSASRGAHAAFVRVRWSSVPNAARYDLWRSGKRIATTTSARYDDRRARAGLRYSYSVRAVSPLGTSRPSESAVGYRS